MPESPEKTKPLRRRARRYNVTLFAAPYERENPSNDERHPLKPVPYAHGGYGVVAEGYIVGPFFIYENAVERCAPLIGGRVVRWVDFVVDSTRKPDFCRLLEQLTQPLTIQIRSYGRPVRITSADKSLYAKAS